ncbi:MAG: YceH family protein [Acidobacteriota bacterium]
MDITLNAVEVRVVGSLIEKQHVTPEYYPLTLNALVNACNQLTNRDPVVSYDETTVSQTLHSLRKKQLIRAISGPDIRVPKYEQALTELFHINMAETAVLCVLMLRGPQTAGELRSRTGRLYNFEGLAEVENTLQRLITREPQPLVTKLPRQPGTKESRYAHLLAGDVEVEEKTIVLPVTPALDSVSDDERIVRLEEEVETLKQELDELKRQFQIFRQQFE